MSNKVMHTAGPWIQDKDSSSEYVRSDSIGAIVAVVFDKHDRRLVSAAPELLDALKDCLSIIADDSPEKSGLINAVTKARAAIRKAEANQP